MRATTNTMWMCFSQKYFGVTEAAPPQDVKDVFMEYTEGGSNMTIEQLNRFLLEFQGDCSAKLADAETLLEEMLQIKHHSLKLTCPQRNLISLEMFYNFLFSADLNPPTNNQVYQDMSAPLSHYFIYTGHNSYLTGNQLSSDCSDVPIIKALKRGVKVVELDLWPNSAKDDVLVLHGWTLTTPVELIKCLKSIKEHAFSASPYPVIITLEDHLTSDLQAKTAVMVTKIFGNMLFYPESLEEFPSPEELKYRVIISTKPPKDLNYGKRSGNGRAFDSQKDKCSDEDASEKGSLDLSETYDENDKSDCDKSQHSQNAGDNDASDRTGFSPAYKRLIAIPGRKIKGGFRKKLSIEHENTISRLSLSEEKFEKAIASYASHVIRFTQRNILRVYPRAARVMSSNYNPMIGWMHGVQMVALNMQGYGKCLWLMHGMFRANGGSGYVKKPDFLMNIGPNNQVFYPKARSLVRKVLKVKLYMGDGWHVDFKKRLSSFWSPPELYTRVGIAGVQADTKMKKTKKRKGNRTPIWDEEFEFPLTVPELALLRIEVHEYNMSEKDYFAGQTCLPVSELRPGIHAVPLFNKKGEPYSSIRLLMRFQFE